MKKLIVCVLAVFSALGSACMASAQARQLRGQIPFDFTAGSARLSAGQYHITYDLSGLVTFHNVDNGATAVTFVGADRGIKDRSCKLIFARYGEKYFLKQSRCNVASVDFFVPTSKLEKKAIERADLNRDGEAIIVAMK